MSLRTNQNQFRSPTVYIFTDSPALKHIIEEMRNHQKEAAIIFIDFKKTFDSVDRNKLFPDSPCVWHWHPREDRQSHADDVCKHLCSCIDSRNFNTRTGVLQADPLAPYLFIIVLDYALRTAIDDREGLSLTRHRSTRHPASHLSDLDYADDIALSAEEEAELLLHKVESASNMEQQSHR